MKKKLGKIGAILFAAVLTLAPCTAAFADTTATGAQIGSDGTVEASNNTVSIKKELVFKNAEATNVREPNITYTYTVTPATGVDATVRDEDGLSGKVKNGVAAAITNATSTVVFADTTAQSATANGTGTIKYANFTFDPTAFTEPGIYRYAVAETSDVTKASVGIVEAATYSANRYLDVYVKKTAADSNTMEIYGYVLYEDPSASTSFDAFANPTVNLDKKSQGYVNTSTTAGSQADVDVYETENLYIDKITTGVMADKNHDFPLSIALTNSVAPKLDVTLSNNAALSNTSSDTLGTYINLETLSGTVRDTSSIVLKGAPVGTTVSITETNDSPDSYKVKADAVVGSAASTNILAEAIVNAGANASPTTAVTMSDKVAITFTNTLDAISPTGLVFRFAPYVCMLAAGIVLLAVGRKSPKLARLRAH